MKEVLKQCDKKPMVMEAECHPSYPGEQVTLESLQKLAVTKCNFEDESS